MTDSALEIKTCQITIPLPPGAKVLVDLGESVLPDEVLAEAKESFQEFNLVKILKASPTDVSRYLLVSPGKKVVEGEILCQRKSLLKKYEFRSPVSGVFTELLPEGFLKIRVGEKREIKSPAKAKVYEVKTDSLALEFEAAVLIGGWGEGGENWGEIEILEKEEITLVDLPKDPSGKIFVMRGRIPVGFVHKAEALGAAGIVGGEATGRIKTVDLAVVTIEGKGGLMPSDLWSTLKRYEKKMAFISGREEKALKIPL